MIKAEQIKAARALLNWKQSDLARATGLSLPSIGTIEREIASPRAETLRLIQTALEKAGIEFIGEAGVTVRQEIFKIEQFEGANFMQGFYDDVWACMHGPQDRIDMCGIDERKFAEFGGPNVVKYAEYQKDVKFRERILIRQNDTYLLAPRETYRWLAPELIGTIPYFLYKDRLSIILWKARRLVILRHAPIAETFRKQFDFLWKLGTPLPEDIENQLDNSRFKRKFLPQGTDRFTKPARKAK